MKKILFYLIIFQLFTSIFSVIPLWNFESSTINLLKNSFYHIYYTFNGSACSNDEISISKTIMKFTNSISEKNYLIIDGHYFSVEFDDIESLHCHNNIKYICPKGKFHMIQYIEEGFQLNIFKPDDFEESDYWELKCFYQSELKYMFIAYLNKGNKFYYYKFDQENPWSSTTNNFHNNLYDFRWTQYGNNYEYPMIYIGLDSNKMNVKGNIFTLKAEYINGNDIGNEISLTDILSYSDAYFTYDSSLYYFYYMTYDKNPPNFKSGYCLANNMDYSHLENVNNVVRNSDSPLDYYYDFNITKMNFTKNTKYVFYHIYNIVKEKTYYGIIDVILNKVIFNTDEKINVFKPYNYNSMLAITNTSAYRICALADGDNCIDSCPSGSYFVDSQGRNFCGEKCPHYILLPNKICIDECDENIFYSNDSYHCGFCIHMDENNQYKLLNKSGCLSEQPEGTYLYNEKYKLLKGEIIIKTTILTTIPTTILTTIPTIILTTIPTTILTTIPTTILTTIATTIPTIVPTTISTIIPLIPSTTCPRKSQCNVDEGLFPINYGNYTNKTFCLKKEENKNYNRVYFDEINQEFRPCYETCKTCEKPGNKSYQNCITCEPGYKLKPEGNPKNNCVVDCPYYTYTVYEQYKCIEKLPCPNEYKFFVEQKNKCIDDCKRDSIYKYQYNGKCYKKCPYDLNDLNYLCIQENECKLTENAIDINYTEFVNQIENLVKLYSNEYFYTNFHVTKYQNDVYDSIVYKNKDCINELSLDFPLMDFGSCYEKVQNKYNITKELIVAFINKKDDINPTSSYSFFAPITGDKLNTDICQNETILLKENILSFLHENMSNYQAIISLMEQGINIFNINDKFYTDLCYEYKLETDKDIAFQDRVKLFYPNISLCHSGCSQISVDIKNYSVECGCKFNDISNKKNNNIRESTKSILIENVIGEELDFLSYSNIIVVKCASKIIHYFKYSYGVYIILFLFMINFIFTNVFYMIDLNKIKIFIINHTESYLKLINMRNNIIKEPPIKNKNTENSNNKKNKLKNDIKINKIKNSYILTSIKRNGNIISNSKETFIHHISTKLNKQIKNKISNKQIKSKSNKNISTNFLNSEKYGKYGQYFDNFLAESPDEMDFNFAIKFDKRKFCSYFADNLKENQIISNTFCSKDLFKSRSIKIIIFDLDILFIFVINALYINDNYISEIYYLEEDNFFSFIPRSIDRFFYTAFAGIIIEFIVGFFFEKENKLKRIFLREKDNKRILKNQVIELLNSAKYKYIEFTIFVICIYGLCLYYVICFNCIYPKIQIEWIKSSIFIFIIRQILSILQCFLETILRFISFRTENERIFKISKMIN